MELTTSNDLSRTITMDIAELGRESSTKLSEKHHSYSPASSRQSHGFKPLQSMDYSSSPSDITLASKQSAFAKAKRHVKHSQNPHKPVPATTVFARGATRLHLPKLDAYIASLERPAFMESGSRWGKDKMFPPMDRLVSVGQSLDDLEANKRIPPFWRNRTGLLGSAVNIVLGVTVSAPCSVYASN